MKALVAALLSTMLAMAGEHLNISICNVGGVPDATVVRAQAVLAAIFRPLQIGIDWASCDSEGFTAVSWPGTDIILRLRTDGPADVAPADSADVMGMAFTAAGVVGDRADAYYGAIEAFARRYHANAAVVLGYVMAHEIGHLLLGPGHVEGTIMSARWDTRTLAAARQRWLTFNRRQRIAIHAELQARTERASRNVATH